MTETTRAELFKDHHGHWRFRLLSKANGEIVSQSEGYSRLQDAKHEAETLVGDEDVELVNEAE